MSRSTPMERIEKLRQQLEEAEKKAAEQEAKKAAAQAERDKKKRSSLEAKLDRLNTQASAVAQLILETQAKLDELGQPAEEAQTLDFEPVSD